MASVEQAVRTRYSCRKFLDRAVPRETLERILDLAQQTPSWCNTQPWQVAIVSGGALRRLGDCLYRHASEGHPARPDFDCAKGRRPELAPDSLHA